MKTLGPENVDYIVVHASATPADMNIGVEEIDRWHRQRGWLQIGYHFVIRRDGRLERGRPATMPGAHVRGYNAQSIGICLIGGVKDDGKSPEDNFSAAQKETLKWVIEALGRTFPSARTLGHRDFPGVAKACPCFDVATFIETHHVQTPESLQ